VQGTSPENTATEQKSTTGWKPRNHRYRFAKIRLKAVLSGFAQVVSGWKPLLEEKHASSLKKIARKLST